MTPTFSDSVINGKTVHGYGAFGFRKEDEDLLKEFNKHLKALIGTKQHTETVRPFGFIELPGDVTAEKLCEGD